MLKIPNISKLKPHNKPYFTGDEKPEVRAEIEPAYTQNIYPQTTLPIYSENPIITKPAQLSLFQMHDFHGQSIRMERAFSAAQQFDNGTLLEDNSFFDKSIPVDRIKTASGDMFLGENKKEIQTVNEFLNLINLLATAIGNHECDLPINDFADIVENRNYKILGANMHPDKDSKINQILSKSVIKEVNGNKYGFIGLVPPDLAKHLKRPHDADEFHISDMEQTAKDLQQEVDNLKKQGVNKIIILSHLGFRNDKSLVDKVADIDVILGAHTHNFIEGVKEGENLFYSPKGEPVLITQVGRDGEFINIPNIKFNEKGQITAIQYNVARTDDFNRNIVAKDRFEKILGKPDVVGSFDYVEPQPDDIYAYENSHCNYILDALKSELGTDIAIMNSANIRGEFHEGKTDTRDLALISPFGNNVTVINISEDELVDRIKSRISKSMASDTHRPGILQVSGLRYAYSMKDGSLKFLNFIDKNGQEIPIDINNPNKNKLYTLACDDFCINSVDSGLNLPHRYAEAIQKFDCDKDAFVASYMKKLDKPDNIKSDGRIKITD